MKILGIIPARFASTRFPGKPLVDIAGKSMIHRVYEQCLTSSSLTRLIVATDDRRILDHVIDFGGEAIMTSESHKSGTDRCTEVASMFPGFDVIVNIQRDDPMIHPSQIDLLCTCFEQDQVDIASLAKKIRTEEELFDHNTPKIILNTDMEAIYFSRAVIPFQRNKSPDSWLSNYSYYKHIGIYAYRRHVLTAISALPVSGLEEAEALEQLRWIENGYRIKIAVTSKESQAIDSPEDLKKVLSLILSES